MAVLSPQQIVAAGLRPTFQAAAAGGDSIQSVDDRTMLAVINGGAGSINVTVGDPGKTPAGNPGTAAAVAVSVSTTPLLIPVGPANVDPATGLAAITYSGVTSVTVAAVRR